MRKMKPIKLPSNVTRAFNKASFQLKKHSPEILVGVGIVGVIAGAVTACAATIKAKDILEEAKSDLGAIHECAEVHKDKYTEEDMKKDTVAVYAKTGLKLAKTYAPAIIIETASIFCILKSNGILRKRNLALAAAYATVDSTFKDYRKRVVERLGEDMDRELRYNIKAKEIEEEVQNEDGTVSKVKTTIETTMNPNNYSDYARIYDDGCIGWTKDPEYNFTFLKMQQSYANDKLKEKGFLFLNDVYEMLGFPMSKAGQVVGWVYDEKHPVGDNYVDFGIFNMDSERARAFVNGYERNIILDFNVDGVVWDLMK
jgi:hypothetical protein